MLNITPIPAFNDNYIWALHNQHYAAVVDPGDAAPVRAWLEARQLKLASILCTHHHHDHVGGICELAQVYNVPVVGPQHEIIPCLSQTVCEGDRVEIAELDVRLAVLHIPGHTLGHIAYFMDADHAGNRPERTEVKNTDVKNSDVKNTIQSAALFCGDTLFGCGCGRLFEGTAAQLHHSLQRLSKLPDDTLVYCAHEYTEANIRFALVCEPGNPLLQRRQQDARTLRASGQPTLPSSIALEKATNPFLRCTEAEIIRTLQHRKLADNAELTVFTALRTWKNQF